MQLFSEASEVIVGRGAEQRGRHLCSFLCHPSRTFTPRDLRPLSTTRMRFSLADFFFFFGMRIGTFFFQGTRHFKKKKADSYPLPPPPTERSHCAMHCTHRPPLSSDQLLEVSKEDFKHFKELVLRLHFFYCSVFT